MSGWRNGIVGFLVKGLVICAGFAAVFVVTYRLNQEYLRQIADTVTVLTTTQDLLPGQPIDLDKLSKVEKPVFGMRDDYVDDVQALAEQGPWYVGDIGFGAGDTIYLSRLALAPADQERWLGEYDRQGRIRLIAVETSLVRSSGDWLWPGAYVDALVYIPARESYDDPQPSQVIGPAEDPLLHRLLIVDIKNSSGATLFGDEISESYSRDLLPAVVTLMVGEDDIERIAALVKYNEEGKIYLSPAEPSSQDGG